MSEHYIVTLDAGHLRIYAKRRPPGQITFALEPVEAVDFPLGIRSYNERDTDQAGRFGGSKGGCKGGDMLAGMSIDERLPMKREEARRRARDLATEIDAFFAQRSDASWDFAAGPELNRAVLDQLSPQVRARLRHSLAKDLVNQDPATLRAHFAAVT